MTGMGIRRHGKVNDGKVKVKSEKAFYEGYRKEQPFDVPYQKGKQTFIIPQR